MATTFEALREEAAVLLTAVTPVSFQDVSFGRHRDEQDLRDWARTFPDACFRRFAIRDLLEYEQPSTSTHEQEWVRGRTEVAIAYPADYRYGEQNKRDQRDVMREDERYVDQAIGVNSYDQYTDGWLAYPLVTHEEEDNVSFLVFTYEFQFNRGR